jgi:hypothetical protein
MIYTLTNPSGRVVNADDNALLQIVLRGDREQFTLHTKVDPKLFTDEADRQTIATNKARLNAAAKEWAVVPLPSAESAPAAPAKPK